MADAWKLPEMPRLVPLSVAPVATPPPLPHVAGAFAGTIPRFPTPDHRKTSKHLMDAEQNNELVLTATVDNNVYIEVRNKQTLVVVGRSRDLDADDLRKMAALMDKQADWLEDE